MAAKVREILAKFGGENHYSQFNDEVPAIVEEIDDEDARYSGRVIKVVSITGAWRLEGSWASGTASAATGHDMYAGLGPSPPRKVVLRSVESAVMCGSVGSWRARVAVSVRARRLAGALRR